MAVHAVTPHAATPTPPPAAPKPVANTNTQAIPKAEPAKTSTGSTGHKIDIKA